MVEDLKPSELGSPIVLLMGIDGCGKTTLINKYIDESEFRPPETELCEDTIIDTNQGRLTIRELGGRFRFRDDWANYYRDSKAMIWVIDSIDRGRLTESFEVFNSVTNHPLMKDMPILIIVNKQDSNYKMPFEEIDGKFHFQSISGHSSKVVLANFRDIRTMTEGFDWIFGNMRK